jgi:hypothetical protein
VKVGDAVRFSPPHWLGGAGRAEDERPWLLGLLVEYHTWEKMATIMYEGQIIRVQARLTEKAGKKDYEE